MQSTPKMFIVVTNSAIQRIVVDRQCDVQIVQYETKQLPDDELRDAENAVVRHKISNLETLCVSQADKLMLGHIELPWFEEALADQDDACITFKLPV